MIVGDALEIGSTGCIIRGSGKRLIAVIDLANMLVVETDDAILICPKDRDQDVKKLVEELRKRGRTELL